MPTGWPSLVLPKAGFFKPTAPCARSTARNVRPSRAVHRKRRIIGIFLEGRAFQVFLNLRRLSTLSIGARLALWYKVLVLRTILRLAAVLAGLGAAAALAVVLAFYIQY